MLGTIRPAILGSEASRPHPSLFPLTRQTHTGI